MKKILFFMILSLVAKEPFLKSSNPFVLPLDKSASQSDIDSDDDDKEEERLSAQLSQSLRHQHLSPPPSNTRSYKDFDDNDEEELEELELGQSVATNPNNNGPWTMEPATVETLPTQTNPSTTQAARRELLRIAALHELQTKYNELSRAHIHAGTKIKQLENQVKIDRKERKRLEDENKRLQERCKQLEKANTEMAKQFTNMVDENDKKQSGNQASLFRQNINVGQGRKVD